MSDTLIVRRAAREDQNSLLNLWIDFLNEQAAMDGRFKIAEDVEERWRNDYEALLRAERRRTYVAVLEGELVGFATATRYAPPPVYALSSEIFVEEIYVSPSVRHRSVGGRLLGAIRSWAEELKANRLRLAALAANADGCAFWEHEGAQPLSITYTIELGAGEVEEGSVKEKARLGF